MSDDVETTRGLAKTVGEANDDEAMLREVLAGLQLPEKRISSKFHYDERGSELFEQVTRLEEYYPTRTERGLLEMWTPAWVRELRPATLVELGAGNAEKSRIILHAMVADGSGEAYVPVDVSHDFLQDTARRLRLEYPRLDILPEVADITAPFRWSREFPQPCWIAFLGSTLGNFDSEGAVGLLTRVGAMLGSGDRFLLGVDLRPGAHKSAERIALAYNDSAGVTAEFSLNVLSILNSEVGSDFDISGFRHRAIYDVPRGRIETYLDSVRDQTVRFPDGTEVSIRAGKSIRTEISCKYDRPTIDDFFAQSGLSVDKWVEDDRGYYALVLGSSA